MNCAKTMKPLSTRPRAASRAVRADEQPLHEELIGAVRGERQRDAAEDAGPERVRRG